MVVSTTYSNINGLWAALLVEELSRWGITHCCIAPGSRSAPVAIAATEHPHIRAITHYDERGLGYLALGLAKASGQAVAALTTSGTAVANLYPAVIEATNSGVPLVVLSADRPPELLDCGANQTISQNRIFAEYPKYTADIPCPSEEIPVAMLLTTIDQALARCCGIESGPIHLNLRFREPLYPHGTGLQDFSRYLQVLGGWLESKRPYTAYRGVDAAFTPPDYLAEQLVRLFDGKGLIIAGAINSQEDAQAVVHLATTLGWPLLADIQSQLRLTDSGVRYYDLLLNNSDFRDELNEFDRVVQFGGRLTSKRLAQWLAGRTWQAYWFVDRTLKREDPQHQVSCRVTQPIATFCRNALEVASSRQIEKPDQHHLVKYDRQMEALVECWLEAQTEPSEVFVARAITEGQPSRANIFLGNSLPVRLVDMFGGFSEHPINIFCNRGASGIDGLLATAVGCSLGGQTSTTLLLGDLSLLHDLNSLALLKRVCTPLVVIVLNNNGGGIFRMLPVPDDGNLVEKCFELPHGFSFAGACEMFGLDYVCPPSKQGFVECYKRALSRPHATVMEVTVSSQETTDMVKRFCRQIGDFRFSHRIEIGSRDYSSKILR